MGKVAMAIDNKLRTRVRAGTPRHRGRILAPSRPCRLARRRRDPLPGRDRVGGVRRAEPGGAPAAGLRRVEGRVRRRPACARAHHADARRGRQGEALALHLDFLAGRGGADGFGVGAGVELRRPALHDRRRRRPRRGRCRSRRACAGAWSAFGPGRLGQAAGLRAMGAVEVTRLARRHGLERRRRHRAQQLDDVRATVHAAQPRPHLAVEAAADAKPDQLLEVGRDVAADR